MAPDQLDPLIDNELERLGLKADAIIPQDEQIFQFDLISKSCWTCRKTASAVKR